MTSFKTAGEIIQSHALNKYPNVDNVDDNSSNYVDTFNVNVAYKEKEERIKAVASDLATQLNDSQNLNYFLKISREHQSAFLYECLSITMDAKRSDKIRLTPAKFFVGVVKQKAGK